MCTYKSIDDLIINNMIDLVNEQKYYDAAKLNYIYMNYPKEQSSVPYYLQKLKDDIQPIQNNQNLSQITLRKLKIAIPEILKIGMSQPSAMRSNNSFPFICRKS